MPREETELAKKSIPTSSDESWQPTLSIRECRLSRPIDFLTMPQETTGIIYMKVSIVLFALHVPNSLDAALNRISC